MRFLWSFFFAVFLAVTASGQSKVADRIPSSIDNQRLSRLQGNVHPLALPTADLGAVSGGTMLERMKLVFQPTAQQQRDLEGLLAAQQDKRSALYHQWLTPEQYGDRFGLSPADVARISQWLRAQGFTIAETSRSRTWIAFSGSATQVQAAFQTEIHQYSVNGKLHYSNASQPSVPSALAGVIAAIAQLNDFAPQSHFVRVDPRLTSSLSGNHFLLPSDFATIYNLQPLYGQGIDGTGQSIAVVGQSDLSVDNNPGRNGQYDVVTFRSLAGLPAANLQTLLVPGSTDPGVVSGDVTEANLDLDWSGGVAPKAALYYVFANAKSGGAFDALLYAVNNNLTNVISVSYGICEPQIDSPTLTLLTNAGQQANAQGQTIVVASGDSGAADCDTGTIATHGLAVDVPSAMPYVTSTGGTTFSVDGTNPSDPTQPTQFWDGSTNDLTGSAFSYIFESAWNDTLVLGSLAASGGGVSQKFTKPSWQSAPGVPADGQRDVPDLSFNSSPAHDGYLICSQSSCVNGFRQADQTFNVIGGTSAAAPSFAGVVALLNQYFKQSQGNINPVLYTQATNYSWVFHDIVDGSNQVPCKAGTTDCPNGGSIGYTAGAGYDLATGLGSVDVMALINAINQTPQPDFWLSPTLRATQFSSDSQSAFPVWVYSLEGFGDAVDLSCSVSASLSGVQCAVSPSHVTPPANPLMGISVAPGSNYLGEFKGTVTLTGASGSENHQVPILVTVDYPNFNLSSSSSPLTIASGGTGSGSVTVTSDRFTGSVQLSCSASAPLGATTCSLNPASLTLSPGSAPTTALTVNAANNTTNSPVTGNITVQGASGTLVNTLPLSVTIGAGDFQVSSSSQSLNLSSGGAGNTTVTVSSAGGFTSDVALACSVSSTLGATTCSVSPATLSGTGTATLTVHAATLTARLDRPAGFSLRGLPLEGGFLVAAVLVLPRRRRRSGTLRARLLGLMALFLLLVTVACGGGGSSTGGGGGQSNFLNGTVTVQATSGSLNHSVQISVTVQ